MVKWSDNGFHLFITLTIAQLKSCCPPTPGYLNAAFKNFFNPFGFQQAHLYLHEVRFVIARILLSLHRARLKVLSDGGTKRSTALSTFVSWLVSDQPICVVQFKRQILLNLGNTIVGGTL